MASTFEAMVFVARSFPLLGMLDSYRSCMTKPQFKHLVKFVAGLMLNGRGEKKVMDIASNALYGRSQSSVNRFLHNRKWSEVFHRLRLDGACSRPFGRSAGDRRHTDREERPRDGRNWISV